MTLKQSFMEAKDIARLQAKPFATLVLCLLVVFIATSVVDPGWSTYIASLPPAFVVALTALARVNDIGPDAMAPRHHVRRCGLVLAGTAAVMVLAWPASSQEYPIAWRVVVLLWGIAGVWLTTPNMPPWDDYITGRYRDPGYSHVDNFAGIRKRKGEQ